MKTFSELWNWVMQRSQRGVMTVQDEHELEHIFHLMRSCDCQSYLEVGAAEGNSLYVLGHAGHLGCKISFIDIGEPHTEKPRQEALLELSKVNKTLPNPYFGDSTDPKTLRGKVIVDRFDCILIDGGHNFATVLSDSILYAPLATKYVFWHDIQLPEVRAAYEWFKKRWVLGEYSEFIASDSFGFGILKVKQ